MVNHQENKINWLDYLILFLLSAVTGIPFFYASTVTIFICTVFIFVIFFIRGLHYDVEFFFIIMAFALVEIMQAFVFGDFSLITILGTSVRLIMAYTAVKVVGKMFTEKYVNLIYVLTWISLFFYGLSFIPGPIEFILKEIAPFFKNPFLEEAYRFYPISPNIIIFTFEPSLFLHHRNPGAFWEPGAYAIFLNLALIFNLIKANKLFTLKNIIIIVGILTTLSTGGYIAMFLTIIFFYISSSKLKYKFIYVTVALILAYLVLVNLDFMLPKVQTDIELRDETTTSRFGSGMVDFQLFLTHPFIGTGRMMSFKYFTIDMHRNNGTMNLLATYGIFIFTLFFVLYYRSFRSICQYYQYTTKFAIYSIIVVIVLGFSQAIFMRPLFYGLMMLFLPYSKPDSMIENKNILSIRNGQN